jgi:two-component system response regulator RegA
MAPTLLRSLLLVDDDELLRERMARAFAKRGLDVRAAADCDEAIRLVRERPPELAVIDLKMPGRSGLELLGELRELSPGTRCVILTGYGSIANAVDAMRLGAVHYLTKPVDADQVLEAFRRDEEPPVPPVPDEIQPPSLAAAEWNHIQQILSDCEGNVTRAADKLGIPRRTLQRKLKKLAP